MLTAGAFELGLTRQARPLQALPLRLGAGERPLERVATCLQVLNRGLHVGEDSRVILPFVCQPLFQADLPLVRLASRLRGFVFEAPPILLERLPRSRQLAVELCPESGILLQPQPLFAAPD